MADHRVDDRDRADRGLAVTRVSASWLALREPADAAAHAIDLVERLPASSPHVIHDLGAGTGAMGRWLAPRLPGRQRWVLHDQDPDLLRLARLPDGVTVETRQSDVTQLRPEDLAAATLVTASALLDMLTEDELVRLVDVAAGAGCPVLLTLSVIGSVEFSPADPFDGRVAAAFNDHQRRTTLGPDAVATAVEEFERRGRDVSVRPSPWRLGPSQQDLLAEWFAGWVRAACEQQADLGSAAEVYTRRRLAQANAGQLRATVDHADLLVLHSAQNRGESA
jgi:hypothetical protein